LAPATDQRDEQSRPQRDRRTPHGVPPPSGKPSLGLWAIGSLVTDQALGQEAYYTPDMATAPGRELKGAETRRRIIRGAWNVIAARGLAGMTTRLVAREAGISHGMCHYHFENKDELVLALVDHVRQYWIDPMELLVAAPGSAR